ncbi:MAG: glycosyltransferase family 39 protein [Planctomycetaceae bacterium]|nr:glycosyltransferase family 39 protein [Planctomycetaceae bacterium]
MKTHLSPDRSPNSRTSLVSQLITRLREIKPVENRRAGWTLIAIGVLIFIILCGRLLSIYDDPSDDDQLAFLNTASEVHDAGGISQLIRDLYEGRFTEANRHPLYIGLLSIYPTLEFGRGLSAMLGLSTLGLLTWLTARHTTLLTAGIFCVLLAINMAFCQFSTRVVCDVLMILWGGVIYDIAARDVASPRLKWSLLIGGLLGLAYLTKGTGVPLVVGVVLWNVLLYLGSHTTRFAQEKRDYTIGRTIQSIVFILAVWLIVSSPLLSRNVKRYGSPLYNVNTWLLFVDEFEQPVELSERMTVGEAGRGYWKSHTISDMVKREMTGLAWEAFILVRMLGPFPLDDSRVLFGVPLLIFGLATVIYQPKPIHVLLVIWTCLLTVMFAWYIPIAAGERFLLPLLAPLLAHAAEGLVLLSGYTGTKLSSG